MTNNNRAPRRVAIASALIALAASCGEASGDQRAKPVLSAKVHDGTVPAEARSDPGVWLPHSVDEQRELVLRHPPASEPRLPEPADDASEPPPVHYVEIYVRNNDELRELDELDIHWDLAPLFDSEWLDGELLLPFEGDPEDLGGQFVYALMPAVTFNAILDASQDEPLYRAIFPRAVPEEVRAPDGSVSYQALAMLDGFAQPHLELIDGQLTRPDVIELPDDKRIGSRIRKRLRQIKDRIKHAIDKIRNAIETVVVAVLPDSELEVGTVVVDRADGVSSRASKVWGPDFGAPLALAKTRVTVQQLGGLAARNRYTDDAGATRVTVAANLPTRICVDAESAAAQFTSGLLQPVRVCGPRFEPARGRAQAELWVNHESFYALAQFIDARAYSTRVLGHEPPKAVVQTGWLANLITRSNGGRAFVPCLASTKAPPAIVDTISRTLDGALVTATGFYGALGGTVVEMLMNVDIVAPGGSLNGRASASHEFGHFALCTLLDRRSPQGYESFWGAVLSEGLSNKDDSEVRGINEGFADFFAAQVAGGTNYFGASDAAGFYSENDFLYNTDGPARGDGMEANWGAVNCGEQQSLPAPSCNPYTAGDQITVNTARIATLLHDMIDRPDCTGADCLDQLSDANVWGYGRDAAGQKNTPATPRRGAPLAADDEAIRVAPNAIPVLFQQLALASGELGFDSFRKVTNEMLVPLYGEYEVCRLFQNHFTQFACFPSFVPPPVTPPPPPPPAPTFTLRGIPSGSGTGSLDAPAAVPAGGSATLHATPDAGSTFTRWSGSDPRCSGSAPSLQVDNLTGDVTCIAEFSALPKPVPSPVQHSVTFQARYKDIDRSDLIHADVVTGTGSCDASHCRVGEGGSVKISSDPEGTVSLTCTSVATGRQVSTPGSRPTITLANLGEDWNCLAEIFFLL